MEVGRSGQLQIKKNVKFVKIFGQGKLEEKQLRKEKFDFRGFRGKI